MIQKFETSLSKIRKHSAVDNRRTGTYNDSHITRKELQAMRNTFFRRKNDAAAATCAAGFACSDANTNNSALLLTIDTVAAVSILAILSILGITPPTGRTKPAFAG